MPQNLIQFQPGMSLDEFFARYGTEAQCAALLEASRWPQGFVCPHCEATAHSRFQADGRGAEGKAVLIAAVEIDDDGYPQHVRFDPLPDLKGDTLRVWVRKALDPNAQLFTDAFASLACAGAEVAAYGAIVVSPRKSSEIETFRWVNTVISNLKTAIRGTYHHFDVHKYLARYLGEAQYRVNRRFDLPSLVGRLLHASVRTPPSREKWLRLGEVRPA